MGFRLWACALALVLATAPLAPTVCRVNCAPASSASSAAAEHHSCHEAPESGINLVPGVHTCGHQNDGTVALQTPGHDMPAPALITSSIETMLAIEHQPRAARSAPVAQSPPGLSSLNAPLRL